jgi:crotonobetainyl-CoA:carnitine CoA-transferase CaiB-like acyl-CoA transferase
MSTDSNSFAGKGPLAGIRVLEVGQLIAGPFTGCFLGYFGAEVIKVEAPGDGDPIRKWRMLGDDGTSLWWRSLGRNKKCITVNLRSDEGRDIVRQLAAKSDVLIENFRPGTMERWGLGPEVLQVDNPGLVYSRISGYGQSGPYATKTGFASVCEGLGGFRHINGFPDRPPVRPNLSMGDTLAALHAALGILMAIVKKQNDPERKGQIIDVAIYEAVFNLMESMIPEYDYGKEIRQCSGSTLTGIVPTNTYECADGKYVIIGGNGDSIYKRLMHAVGRDDLGEDPRMADNAGRVDHEPEIDAAIAAWIRQRDSDDVLNILAAAEVPSGPIYDAADMMADEHFQARGLFEQVEVNGRSLAIPAIPPFLSDTPGATQWPGPEIGAHNDHVLHDMLGIDAATMVRYKAEGII